MPRARCPLHWYHAWCESSTAAGKVFIEEAQKLTQGCVFNMRSHPLSASFWTVSVWVRIRWRESSLHAKHTQGARILPLPHVPAVRRRNTWEEATTTSSSFFLHSLPRSLTSSLPLCWVLTSSPGAFPTTLPMRTFAGRETQRSQRPSYNPTSLGKTRLSKSFNPSLSSLFANSLLTNDIPLWEGDQALCWTMCTHATTQEVSLQLESPSIWEGDKARLFPRSF